MKTFLVLMAGIAVCSSAVGGEPLFNSRTPKGDPHMCSLKASVFEGAATARDHNGTPALARQMTAAYKEVPQQFRDTAIKLVFESAAFDRPGRQLYQIVLNDCLYKGGFQ
ncbi:hypothetical protein ACIPEN_22260 [Herbaspirillum chlorophenolicum]|uniref:Lipoprotein n=1 Tax=Herbaspirillum chlorophenolicum TaxID=211589 RepID=A0ABW8F5J6_9BURK